MRIRNVKNANEIVFNHDKVIKNGEEYKGNWNKLFGNNNKICLEIGMGKGDFLIDMALKNPNTNFIGIEKYTSIVVRALKKIDELELNNLLILNIDALNVDKIFDKEIDTIYLNFSDPWPKKRCAKRRLTSEVFLKLYDKVFIGDKKIIQKTDNNLLFESSIVSLSNYGYVINEISLDLANTDIETSLTEYEKKFRSMGVPIKYLSATKKL